jgi:hypothetical protein
LSSGHELESVVGVVVVDIDIRHYYYWYYYIGLLAWNERESAQRL